MQNILLISEGMLKENSELTDNLYGSYLLPAIRTSQEIYIQQVLGRCLYNKILDLVDSGEITEPENQNYKELLDDFIQPCLIERVLADLVPIVSAKITNIGTVHNKDEYVQNLSVADAEKLQQMHIVKYDFYVKQMQRYLLDNLQVFPELDQCTCDALRSNLDSAASSGLWLGGERNPYPFRRRNW